MPEAQHGRRCSCADCVLSVSRRAPAVVPWVETATRHQLRDSYEAALDVMQRMVEAPLDQREHRLSMMRQFLDDAGRKIR